MVQHLRLLSVCLAIASIQAPAFAEVEAGHDVDACQGDVHRLCEALLPDAKAVATCLVERRSELSVGCAEVLASPPSDGPDPAPTR